MGKFTITYLSKNFKQDVITFSFTLLQEIASDFDFNTKQDLFGTVSCCV